MKRLPGDHLHCSKQSAARGAGRNAGVVSSRGGISYRLLLLIAVGASLLAATLQFRTINNSAYEYAETGQSLIRFLDQYKEELAKGDVAGLIEYYEAPADIEFFWESNKLPALSRDGVHVQEWVPRAKQDDSNLKEQFRRFLGTLSSIEEIKFKLDALEETPSAESAMIRSVLWVRGTTTGGEASESFGHYQMSLRSAGRNWTIEKQKLIHGRTVIGPRRGFTEIAQQAGIDFASQFNPLFFQPEWEPKTFGIIKYGPAGVSAADYNNDGWYDIFFSDGKSPRLYRNDRDGTFSDATEQAGLPAEMLGINVGIFADFDNDGDKDLFLGCFTSENRLFRNNGDGSFSDVTKNAGLGGYFVSVAAAADYNNDGRVDLYVGRYLDPRKDLPTTLFYTRNGQGNSLLRNDGDLSFTDVTAEAGVREGGLALGVAWGDYDADGDQDIYVANDFGRNALLQNSGDGTFADVSKRAGALDHGFGMSATFGDIDNDNDLDIYVSNVHSSQRWYAQAPTLYKYFLTSIRQGTLTDDLPLYKLIYGEVGAEWHSYGDRTVKGNSLLTNDGKGHYTDVSEATRANPFGWYWGSTFFDYDNDGWQDIYASNGWISGRTKHDF